MRISHVTLRAGIAALFALAGSLAQTAATPARATETPEYTVSLTVSQSSVPTGTVVTLTATADRDVGDYYVDIVTDLSNPSHTHVGPDCGGGTVCTTTVHFSTAGSHTYYAIVDQEDWTILAQSTPRQVTWFSSASTVELPQSYAIDPIPDHHLGDPPVLVTGRGDYVTAPAFSATGACSLSPDSIHLILTGAGSCRVTAFLLGVGNYMSYTSEPVTFTILPDPPAVTWPSPADIPYGTALGSTELDATSSMPGTFAYTPAAGTVLPVGASQALTTTFTPADVVNNTPVVATTTITVTRATQHLTLYQLPNLAVGTAVKVVANPGASGAPVVLAASGACTLDADGVTLTPSAAGFCTITANESGNAQYLDAPAVTQTVSVQAKPS